MRPPGCLWAPAEDGSLRPINSFRFRLQSLMVVDGAHIIARFLTRILIILLSCHCWFCNPTDRHYGSCCIAILTEGSIASRSPTRPHFRLNSDSRPSSTTHFRPRSAPVDLQVRLISCSATWLLRFPQIRQRWRQFRINSGIPPSKPALCSPSWHPSCY
jgi:hypothetical protein